SPRASSLRSRRRRRRRPRTRRLPCDAETRTSSTVSLVNLRLNPHAAESSEPIAFSPMAPPEKPGPESLHAEIEELFAELWQVPRFAGLRRGFRPNVDSYHT